VAQFIQNVDSPANQGYVREVLNASDANTRLRTILPNVYQGTDIDQRIGNTITPVKLRLTIRYYTDFTNTRALECYVRQFLLTSKSVKNPQIWAAEGDDETVHMLNRGNGTYTAPVFGASPQTWAEADLPIASPVFSTLPKGNKTFKFAKQPGLLQNESTADGIPVYAPNRVTEHKCVVTIKCPKLHYTQESESGLNNYIQPTNFNPLFGACGYTITNESAACYRQLLGTISGGGIGVPANPIIRYTLFSELWFKDD